MTVIVFTAFDNTFCKRWEHVLNEEDFENYRATAKRYLDADGIHWLENGTI